MIGIITKKKLLAAISDLADSCDGSKADGIKDFYWRCGNANAVNYILHKIGIKNKSCRAYRRKPEEGK